MSESMGGFLAIVEDPDPILLRDLALDAIGDEYDDWQPYQKVLGLTCVRSSLAVLFTFCPSDDSLVWHWERRAFAEALSAELATTCIAFGVENAAGSEQTAVYDCGSCLEVDECSWDDRGEEQWPLSRLAAAIGYSHDDFAFRAGSLRWRESMSLSLEVETAPAPFHAQLRALRAKHGTGSGDAAAQRRALVAAMRSGEPLPGRRRG